MSDSVVDRYDYYIHVGRLFRDLRDRHIPINVEINTIIQEQKPADVSPVVHGAPLIEVDSPWEPMQTNKERFYYTKQYYCRNCKLNIKTESWERDRCFGGGTVLKDNSMPSFCPYCGASLKGGGDFDF